MLRTSRRHRMTHDGNRIVHVRFSTIHHRLPKVIFTMKKLLIATAIAIAIPALAFATEAAPVVPAPLAGPPIKVVAYKSTGSPLTFVGQPSLQEQYKAVCDGTSDSPNAAILKESYCGAIKDTKRLELSPKQQAIYDDWLLYRFWYSKDHVAAIFENSARHYGRPDQGSPTYRPPLTDKELESAKQGAGMAAYFANEERKKLIATLNVTQARTMLLTNDVAWTDPYYDYSFYDQGDAK